MGLQRLLPQTMAGLFTCVCLGATLPLLLAVVLAQLSLNRLADRSEQLIRESVELARLGVQVREDVIGLGQAWQRDDRLERQEAGAGFDLRLQRVQGHLNNLQSLRLAQDLREPIHRVQQGLDALTASATGTRRDAAAPPLAILSTLRQDAQELIERGNVALDMGSEDLGRRADEARRVVSISLLALLPLTVLLALGLASLVTRPLRQAGRGIATMGRGVYSEPVAIAYPREMRELGEHIDWLRQRLGELEEDQDRFLRNISHELKTPLASLIQGLDLLANGKMGPLNERQAEVTEILGESAGELGALIGNLLAYARWQSERETPEMAWFDAGPLVEEVIAPRKLLLASHQLQVRLELCSEPLFGDRARLKEALDNLVSNAIKHTQKGTGIEICARVGPKLQTLAVRDFGRGVPVKDQRRIFDPFIRGAEMEEAGVRGTGIGLTIVRETAQAHAGRVEVQNANPGARFEMQWPVGVAAG